VLFIGVRIPVPEPCILSIMKKHEMKLNQIPYSKIANGNKIIESRLYDDKRKLIQLGDIIKFVCVGTDTSVTTLVQGLYLYSDFKSLFNDFDPKLFGGENADKLYSEIEQFYSPEDQKKYGVVGIRLKKI
jgi:ASC-1-like (ASCH) protein